MVEHCGSMCEVGNATLAVGSLTVVAQHFFVCYIGICNHVRLAEHRVDELFEIMGTNLVSIYHLKIS